MSHSDSPSPQDAEATDAEEAQEVEGYLQRGDRSTETSADALPDTFPLSVDEVDVDEADVVAEDVDPRAQRDARLIAQRDAGATPISRAQFVSSTRRSLLAAAGALAVAGVSWGWLQRQAESGNIPAFLRDGFEWNDTVWSTLFDKGGLAPEFAVAEATSLRLNGNLGIGEEIDLDSWTLTVQGIDGQEIDQLTIDDISTSTIAGVPTFDMVTEHKCIEGWSNITHWTGIRFSDLATRYEQQMAQAEYVSMETPDGEYYVGLDMASVMHPQTLLVSALDGEPLTQAHGAPLRLATPLHYGIKSLKRLGTIRFSAQRPDDYWAERGYDYHSTH
ncbi:MAG: molybdopterin-dependent oxidoreductase [Euzebya sp.]